MKKISKRNFYGCKKAFDHVVKNQLLKQMIELGIDKHLLK